MTSSTTPSNIQTFSFPTIDTTKLTGQLTVVQELPEVGKLVFQEIKTALRAGLKIIPVTDEFQWPAPESLAEDIRKVTTFNGVRWVHDYQVSSAHLRVN